ncbi:mediator of RNA polymerase II transcription subunit 28 isoform X1 [Primulina eburnea]|uniref:mediator of RNA polymerase II transcription subunit 28 isoform X1 n=2 Tax=Primulina eburnea TaxID=1245227 RepID=UPI003C6CC05D
MLTLAQFTPTNLEVIYSSFTWFCVLVCLKIAMAERQQHESLNATDPSPKEDMISYVMALEAALLPCLPARELQAIDRSPHPSHQIDVERHARDFMEAAKKLQLYFISLQRDDPPTREETLRKEIAMMEEELKVKAELIKKQERLIQGWRSELKEQFDKHNIELERV